MINEQLNELFSEWKNAMLQNGHQGFCYDGLIYRKGKEDLLWRNSKRRIVFLLKEQNDNDGEDVREWSGSINGLTPNGNFFNRLSAWLYGLTHITASTYPSLDEAFDPHNQMKALQEYPYAYVNVKKETGGAVANDNVVYTHATKYASFIRRELDILNGNIIVCGGDVVFRAARDLVYKDITFNEINDWVYYSQSHNLLLINSYHPAAHKSNEVMYVGMMEALVGNINLINLMHFNECNFR